MHAPIRTLIPRFGTAKIIEIGEDVTKLQSNVRFMNHCKNVGFNFSRYGVHINRVMW